MCENLNKKIKLDFELEINQDELYSLLYYNYENTLILVQLFL